MNVSAAGNRIRVDLIVATGCLLALAAIIALSPPQLKYDERNHIGLTELVAKNGWHDALISPENHSAAGPLYPAIHLALSFITNLQVPAIRWVNFFCFLGIVLLLASYKPTAPVETSIVTGLSLLAIPFLWPAVGMALTELPALLFFTCFVLLFVNLIASPFAFNSGKFGLALVAGCCLGIAILGRQTYLVIVPVCLIMTFWMKGNSLPAVVSSLTALAVSGWLFALWHGLVPPQYYQLSYPAVSFSYLLLSLSYAAIATLFLNPLWLLRERDKGWMLCALCGIALAYFARNYEDPPAKSLLIHLVGTQMGLSIGFVIGCALGAIGVIWAWVALKVFWRERQDPARAFLMLSLGALVLAPMKMTAQFSSRYVVGCLGVLLLVIDSPREFGRYWAARMVFGSFVGIAIVWTYFQQN